MPLKYTCTPPSLLGRVNWVVSAATVRVARSVPSTETIVPGAMEAASPPPASVLPLAVATICATVALLATVTVA